MGSTCAERVETGGAAGAGAGTGLTMAVGMIGTEFSLITGADLESAIGTEPGGRGGSYFKGPVTSSF